MRWIIEGGRDQRPIGTRVKDIIVFSEGRFVGCGVGIFGWMDVCVWKKRAF